MKQNELGVRASAVAAVFDELASYWGIVEPMRELVSGCRKVRWHL